MSPGTFWNYLHPVQTCWPWIFRAPVLSQFQDSQAKVCCLEPLCSCAVEQGRSEQGVGVRGFGGVQVSARARLS